MVRKRRKKTPVKPQPAPRFDKRKLVVGALIVGMLCYACVQTLYYLYMVVQGGGEPTSHVLSTITAIAASVFKLLMDSRGQ